MMLAETKTEFESKLSDFRESEKENTKNVEYFEENWLNCVSKWAKYERVNLPLNLQETNNPVEVVNKQFKGFSNKHASNSIAVCCDSIFKYVRSIEINSLLKTQDSKYPKEIKGVFLQRCFKFLGNILIKNDLLLKFLSNEEKIEETHIIVDSTILTVESFFVFYQFLKDDSDFFAFFTEDGRQQLLSLIHNYKILQSCSTCSVLILIDEDFKICYDCMKLYHLKCIKQIKSKNKKYFCTKCPKI